MYLDRLFKLMAEKQASDLFISCGAPINIKINGVVSAISTQPMDVETVRRIAYELMTKDQAREFENEMEMNLSYLDRSVGNFRINIFRQRGTISLAIRYVRSHIPPFADLKLPSVLLNLVMEKRGLVLIAGATGSGKSTTLAAMIDYRNASRRRQLQRIGTKCCGNGDDQQGQHDRDRRNEPDAVGDGVERHVHRDDFAERRDE